MKRLILKKLIIISQKNEAARVINFNEELNIITSDNPHGKTINRTGKSVVMKSIYHAMGAKLKKYTTNWKTLQISTIISFLYDNEEYELYRNADSFILKDSSNIRFFATISELKQFYIELFDFHIKMPIKSSDDNAVYAYPGAIFMPFYIDQDKGWTGSWDSFSDVFSGKWKTEVLLYHMGIRTKEYYNLLDEKIELETEQRDNKRQLKTYEDVIKNHTEKYKDYLDINIDIEDFTDDILSLTNELNLQLKKKNKIKEELITCFNEMKDLEELYLSAEVVYRELLEDADYAENELTDENIICPICGTTHKNSVENKFHIYSEIEECEQAIQEYFEEKAKIEIKIEKQSQELEELNDYIKNINEILNRKRESITFKEVVVSEGSKSILADMQKEQKRLNNRYLSVADRLHNITKLQSAITRKGTHITKEYLQRLSVALQVLNVTDIDLKDLKSFKSSFSSGGNDLPCAILAQVYTIYSIAVKYSRTVCAPIVLDAIFQQEPAEAKINDIWDYVINYKPKESQLIISTTTINDRKFDGNVISFTKEKGLLQAEDYLQEMEKIKRYKSLLLNEMKKRENEKISK
ncbi:MAG: hypothetical protein E6712_13770 [Clostridium sp.]|uniref:hypothetical protein n=1 Tax=Clostridium TaxID=1485 RepID=UPI002901574C|nr:hypothetical protein [Clostridium sp.]MDU1937224.1 hypothetical protein [Clostridium sp.]MDU2045855.1 hypothetical protein [Clostridium sp.]